MSQGKMSIDRKDVGTGLLFLMFALFFAVSIWGRLPLGGLSEMGPGLFPLLLAGLLSLIGTGLVLRGVFRGGTEIVLPPVAIRGALFVLFSPIVFGLVVIHLGFVPAVIAVTIVAALADTKLNWWRILLLAFAMAAFCTLIFKVGLGLGIPFVTWDWL